MTWDTWCFIFSSWSRCTLRLRTLGMLLSSGYTRWSRQSSLSSCSRVPNVMNSVLSMLSFSLLANIKCAILAMHSSSDMFFRWRRCELPIELAIICEEMEENMEKIHDFGDRLRISGILPRTGPSTLRQACYQANFVGYCPVNNYPCYLSDRYDFIHSRARPSIPKSVNKRFRNSEWSTVSNAALRLSMAKPSTCCFSKPRSMSSHT